MPPLVFVPYFNICQAFQQKIYLKCVQITWHLAKDNMSNYGSKDLKYFRLKLKVKLKTEKKQSEIHNPFRTHPHDHCWTKHLSARD